MNVVVTGGAGFIGSNLVDRLVKARHRVTIIDNFAGGRREFIDHHLKAGTA
jgi:nucleoside-diphosphate-sugar epimerase